MKIVIDLDNTITVPGDGVSYEDLLPNRDVVAKLREYSAEGFGIVIHTSRNMRTHAGNLGKINVETLPRILRWLAAHDIPHDEVVVGKPWCEHDGFYVDDKAIRPDEFVKLSLHEIYRLVGRDSSE